eukprot:gene20109-26109_t
MRNGRGKYTYSNGDIYEGNWNNNKYHGYGKIKFTDGGKYEGIFSNGLYHGKGKYEYANGKVYDGNWVNGVYEGYGRLSNDLDAYEGNFVNNKKDGYGKLICKNGDVYDGEFSNNKRNGKGNMKYSNGNMFDGEWFNDKYNGIGILTFANGNLYEGSFTNDIIQGYGVYSYADGRKNEGQWINGKFIGNDDYNKNNSDSVITAWDVKSSDDTLIFADDNTSCRRNGSASCYPAAFALIKNEFTIFNVVLEETSSKTNWLTVGLGKKNFPSSYSDGFGRTSDSWGIADGRASDTENAFFAYNGTNIQSISRKLKLNDVICLILNLKVGSLEISVNYGEFSHTFGPENSKSYFSSLPTMTSSKFTISTQRPLGYLNDFIIGATLADDHKFTIKPPLIKVYNNVADIRKELNVSSYSAIKSWDINKSDNTLSFTNNNTSCRREGSISCYPAAFAVLSSRLTVLNVILDEISSKTNWLTIGLGKKSFASSYSDGFGRSSDSWGIADDRSKESENAFFAYNGIKVQSAPRPLKLNDVISLILNLDIGSLEISVNYGEFSHIFGPVYSNILPTFNKAELSNKHTISSQCPIGSPADFVFGATLGFNSFHVIKNILFIDSTLVPSL